MPKVIISDTSCLIILTKIGEIELLRQLYKTVTITQDILLEIGESLPVWYEVKQVKDHYRQQLLEMQIDKGEASAIALALETSDSIVILDDWKARKVAHIGTYTQAGVLCFIRQGSNKLKCSAS